MSSAFGWLEVDRDSIVQIDINLQNVLCSIVDSNHGKNIDTLNGALIGTAQITGITWISAIEVQGNKLARFYVWNVYLPSHVGFDVILPVYILCVIMCNYRLNQIWL